MLSFYICMYFMFLYLTQNYICTQFHGLKTNNEYHNFGQRFYSSKQWRVQGLTFGGRGLCQGGGGENH